MKFKVWQQQDGSWFVNTHKKGGQQFGRKFSESVDVDVDSEESGQWSLSGDRFRGSATFTAEQQARQFSAKREFEWHVVQAEKAFKELTDNAVEVSGCDDAFLLATGLVVVDTEKFIEC